MAVAQKKISSLKVGGKTVVEGVLTIKMAQIITMEEGGINIESTGEMSGNMPPSMMCPAIISLIETAKEKVSKQGFLEYLPDILKALTD